MFKGKSVDRTLFERRVGANIGDFVEPDSHLAIRLRRLQWNVERFAQVAMEAFDLALRLRTVRRTQSNRNAVVLSDI